MTHRRPRFSICALLLLVATSCAPAEPEAPVVELSPAQAEPVTSEQLIEVNGTELFVKRMGAGEPGVTFGGAANAEAIPDALRQTIPDAGHFPMIENPAAFLAAVRGFLGQVGG
jgi:hypothetical protein